MSTPIYHPRGVTFRDVMVYLDAAGVGVTGKTGWTITLTKNAATQAVAGTVTVAEIDATNNPGAYAVTATIAGFPAADGVYNLKIADTAVPYRTWEQTIIVNTDGLPATTGVAFSATVSDGRVMSGGVALPNAQVIITQGSTIYAILTTNSLGLWGPVYFTVDGTYGVTVQASGYTSVNSTIVVSGSGTIATGPGADLTLTQTSTNPLTASELWAYFTRQARDVAGTKADVERKQGVQDALDMLAKEGQWNWLLRRGFLALKGAVSMTVTLTNGSAAVSSADTFPAWAADGRMFGQSQVIDIATRTDANNIVLEAPWVGTTGDYTVWIFQDEYALPTNTLWFHQLIPYQRWTWGGSPTSPEVFFQRQSGMMYGQQFPACWIVHAGNLCLYPYPSTDATVAYTHYIQPAQLVSGADIADWDPAQVEVLRRAIDVQVVNRYGSCAGGDANTIMARYKEALARARTTDREPTSVSSALDDVDVFDERLGRTWRQRPRG